MNGIGLDCGNATLKLVLLSPEGKFLWEKTAFHYGAVVQSARRLLGALGVLAVLAILTHKELLLPILCGIFYVEDLSVMIQVAYFKFTKKRYGEGRRVFRMTPLHHHFQKEPVPGMEGRINCPSHAIPEPKIVTRFWIVCIFLAVITFVTLKIR